MKKMLFIYNPKAGKAQIRNKLADILDVMAEKGARVTVHSQKLTAQAAGTKNGTITWLSSNPDVAQVSTDGTVTAVGDGETVILAISPEGRADACYVAVGTAAWRYRSEDELAETLTLTGQLPYSDGK